MTRRGGIVLALAIALLIAVGGLLLQGDICDGTSNPQQCRIDFPER